MRVTLHKGGLLEEITHASKVTIVITRGETIVQLDDRHIDTEILPPEHLPLKVICEDFPRLNAQLIVHRRNHN